jgi:hypothetical protein
LNLTGEISSNQNFTSTESERTVISKETEHSGAYEVWLPTSYWHEHQKEANHVIRKWLYVFPDENRVSLG